MWVSNPLPKLLKKTVKEWKKTNKSRTNERTSSVTYRKDWKKATDSESQCEEAMMNILQDIRDVQILGDSVKNHSYRFFVFTRRSVEQKLTVQQREMKNWFDDVLESFYLHISLLFSNIFYSCNNSLEQVYNDFFLRNKLVYAFIFMFFTFLLLSSFSLSLVWRGGGGMSTLSRRFSGAGRKCDRSSLDFCFGENKTRFAPKTNPNNSRDPRYPRKWEEKVAKNQWEN